MTMEDITELDTEIREMHKVILEIDNSIESTREKALINAKSDLAYLLTLLSI